MTEFQVTLASNVISSVKNSPTSFVNDLARPLELNGEWEVALIDITYTHEWFTLHQDYEFAIAMPNANQAEIGTLQSDVLADQLSNGAGDSALQPLPGGTNTEFDTAIQASPNDISSHELGRIRKLLSVRQSTRTAVNWLQRLENNLQPRNSNSIRCPFLGHQRTLLGLISTGSG